MMENKKIKVGELFTGVGGMPQRRRGFFIGHHISTNVYVKL